MKDSSYSKKKVSLTLICIVVGILLLAVLQYLKEKETKLKNQPKNKEEI